MHLIPDSWSHLHMLVSVFPSVGLIFALVMYVAAMITNSDAMKRVCLFIFAGLGVLAIPTYFSGDGSMALLAKDPKVSQELMNSHLIWSYAALAMLVLLGAVSGFEWWRSRGTKRLSSGMLNVILALGAVTLVLMGVVGELGWEIAHHELAIKLTPEQQFDVDHGAQDGPSSQTWSHVHIILNHFPTVGFVFALFFFVWGLVASSDSLKRGGLSLFAICAVFVVPTYVTGAASMSALTDPPQPGIFKAAINAHRDMALLSLFGLAFTGCAAWMELFRYRHTARFSKTGLKVVLGFAIITLAVLAETGHRGGLINHPEIRSAADVFPTENPDAGYWTPYVETQMGDLNYFVPWQILHFFGYSFIFGTILVVVLRVLGMWKSVSFAAVHRFLPLAVFGVVLNVFTGMLMFVSDSFGYANHLTFGPKMALIVVGSVAALYLTLSQRLWEVKAGEDAPMSAKLVAIVVLVAWTGVLTGGRLIQYL